GTRVGAGINKAFLQLAGRSIAAWGLNTLGAVEGIGLLVFVVRPEDLEHARFVDARETEHPLEIITGGETRQESELPALRHLADRIDSGAVDTVLIHDAARPLVSHGLVSAVLHAARESGGAVPGIPAADIAAVGPGDTLAPGGEGAGSLVRVQTPQGFHAARPLFSHGLVAAVLHAARETGVAVPGIRAADIAAVGRGDTLAPGGEGAGSLVRVQTPQGFHAATILDAYEAAARDDFVGTD